MLATAKCMELSSGTRMKAARSAGSRKPTGSPSTSMPTRPFSRCMAKVSGLSVCSSCGSGERGASTIYSSRSPAASRPSMSMSEMRLSASSATLCWATPYTYIYLRRRCRRAGHDLLRDFKLRRAYLSPHQGGVGAQGLHKGVLAALDSLLDCGSLTERVSLVRVSKVRASPRESKQTAQ